MNKDLETIKCKEFLKGKRCEFCEKVYSDGKNRTGWALDVKNFPKFESEEEFFKDRGEVTGLIRCKPVCKKHFTILRRDNDKRIDLGSDIPVSLELIKFRLRFI